MKILITGGTGLLGKALIETADSRYKILATYLNHSAIKDTTKVQYVELDVRDKAGYIRLFRDFRPAVVIHTASISSPDYAEKNADETWEINVGGTSNILAGCRQVGSKFIYISSNGIYDGEKAPYSEEDEATPVNCYGRIKKEGEKVTRESDVPYGIVRPILMYGWNHSFERFNIVTIALARLKEGEKVFAYDNVYSNPLFAQSCANSIWKMIEKELFETFNIAGKDRVSIYGLLKRTAEVFGLDSGLIIPVKQGFFNELVKRPVDTSYNTEKMQKVLGIEPLSLDEGLRLMKHSEVS